MKVYFTTINSNATLPRSNFRNDAGYDIFASENITIPPESIRVVSTGLQMQMEEKYVSGLTCVAKICSRSGLAAKHGVFVLNAPGIIDSGYRGEIKVILYNTEHVPHDIKIGDRIAQILFEKVFKPEIVLVERLDQTERGNGGFGSTGLGFEFRKESDGGVNENCK